MQEPLAMHDRTNTAQPARAAVDPRKRGVALIEFALAIPMLIILVMGTIDIGRLIQSRMIITNVAREGASIASRQVTVDAGLPNLLIASGKPLDLAGADGRVIVTRISASKDPTKPNPTIDTQIVTGGLGVGSKYAAGAANMGLPANLYNWLKYDATKGTSVISSVTMVEVAYKFRPVTPLPNFVAGMLVRDGGGMILRSTALF